MDLKLFTCAPSDCVSKIRSRGMDPSVTLALTPELASCAVQGDFDGRVYEPVIFEAVVSDEWLEEDDNALAGRMAMVEACDGLTAAESWWQRKVREAGTPWRASLDMAGSVSTRRHIPSDRLRLVNTSEVLV